ncbi:MAG: glycoside hydrolase family 1 protein [bacterium]
MSIHHFPKDFLWGASTSSHQVEGGNIWNDWYEFEMAGGVKDKVVSGIACDHYHRYKEDFGIAKELNQNAQRISIEWSRIEKTEGTYDEKELEHYRKVLTFLKQNGFKTFVTLHHFTNPIWLAKQGGWANKKVIKQFARYTEHVVNNLGDLVDYWMTINEPNVYLSQGYLIGNWPPEKYNLFQFIRSGFIMADAHKAAFDVIKKINPDYKIGIVYNFSFYATNYYFRKFFKKSMDYSRNFLFMDRVRKHLDFIGMNYYFPSFYEGASQRTDLDWPISPEGLHEAIAKTYHRYNLPIIITENGIADCDDKERKYFILEHIKSVALAIKDGANVGGYLHWSLLDNFEWREGFTPRFGLIEIDYDDLSRKIRDSAYLYAKICKENSVDTQMTLSIKSAISRSE